MAATSFKQQCPSCEAMVPVRDPNLIGRKIDCPKCKYRFVVEEPAGNGAAEEPAEATVTTKARAKGQRGTATGPAVKTAGARRRRGEDEDRMEETAAPKPKSTAAWSPVISPTAGSSESSARRRPSTETP